MVWHRAPLGEQYWEWASPMQHLVLTISAIRPWELWMELYDGAVVLFTYQA